MKLLRATCSPQVSHARNILEKKDRTQEDTKTVEKSSTIKTKHFVWYGVESTRYGFQIPDQELLYDKYLYISIKQILTEVCERSLIQLYSLDKISSETKPVFYDVLSQYEQNRLQNLLATSFPILI